MKLLGREPVLLLGALGAILALLAPHVHGLSAGTADAFVALITAALAAWATRPWQPAAFKGLVAAAFALVAQFGLHVPDAQVGEITAAVMSVLALLVRAQVTPAADPAPIITGPAVADVEPGSH